MIEKVVHVGPASASANACDLGKGPCTVPLTGGGEVTLELGPRPLRPCASSPSRRTSERRSAAGGGRRGARPFAMKGMRMGDNTTALAPAGGGRLAGKAVPCAARADGRTGPRTDGEAAGRRAAHGALRAHGGRVTDAVAMAFVTGLLGGFGHCIGMCGPLVGSFALATGALGPRRSLAGQLAYHGGRITTYAVLGAVEGLTGSFVNVAGRLAGLQDLVAVVAGVLMILLGLGAAGVSGR